MKQTKSKTKRKSVRFNLEKNKTKYFLYDSSSKARRSTRKMRQKRRTNKLRKKMRRGKSMKNMRGGRINPVAEFSGIVGAIGSGVSNAWNNTAADAAARPAGNTPVNNVKSSLPFQGHFDTKPNTTQYTQSEVDVASTLTQV